MLQVPTEYKIGEGKTTYFFIVWEVGRIISCQSASRTIIIILSFKVDTSKNKNIDHRGYV